MATTLSVWSLRYIYIRYIGAKVKFCETLVKKKGKASDPRSFSSVTVGSPKLEKFSDQCRTVSSQRTLAGAATSKSRRTRWRRRGIFSCSRRSFCWCFSCHRRPPGLSPLSARPTPRIKIKTLRRHPRQVRWSKKKLLFFFFLLFYCMLVGSMCLAIFNEGRKSFPGSSVVKTFFFFWS